jgi:hypothetical protein
MRDKILSILLNIKALRAFFPLQLCIAQLKYNGILLLFWAVLFSFILKIWGNDFGIPLLFLDPEYMGKVSFTSYLILGASCGSFIMAYQIASYIVNSYRFPFLSTITKPFVKYTINNFIFPLSFIITYIVCNYRFQIKNEEATTLDIVYQSLGFLVGSGFFYIVSLTYFFAIGSDFFKLLILNNEPFKSKNPISRIRKGIWKKHLFEHRKGEKIEVLSYLNHPFELTNIDSETTFDYQTVKKHFRTSHLVAAIFELLVIAVVVILGLFRDSPFFRIPAAASIFISFTMLLMIASAFHTWLKAWSIPIFIVLFVLINWLSGYEFFGKRNQAFGLDYKTQAAIIPEYIRLDKQLAKQIEQDSLQGIAILEKWKVRSSKMGKKKPTLIFLNVSGGGLKSALWTVEALQAADKATAGRLLRNTHLITGSSGGMIGAAFMRELYLRKIEGHIQNIYDSKYGHQIGKDLLNAIGYSLAVSDIFLRLQKIEIDQKYYTRDRGYEFEKALHENTEFILDKKLSDYEEPESKAIIPMMIFTPTIINDGRRLLISPIQLSYLTSNVKSSENDSRSLSEDIEFSKLFKQQGAGDLRFGSAIRMNATFPYILPSVSLPSKPIIEVMDAGYRDNFGAKTSIRYLYNFRDWLAENTDQVVFLQIRENHKSNELRTHSKSTISELMLSPLGNVYDNLSKIQDYQNEQLCMYAQTWFKGKITFVEMDLNPPLKPEGEVISMNFHLTSLEKKRIHNAIELPENKKAIKKLQKILL